MMEYPVTPCEPEVLEPIYTPESKEAILIAKTIYGEARGIASQTQQAAVAWCILNRVDLDPNNTVESVITYPNAFIGYREGNPTVDDFGRDLAVLAADVLNRWALDTEGRVLPKDYYWFSSSRGGPNRFRNAFKTKETWDWSLPSPYES